MMSCYRRWLTVALLALSSLTVSAADPYLCGDSDKAIDTKSTPLNLHVPSPDWAQQIIYMVQLDRFNDGDPERNDLGQGEYDPAQASHYSGGDIQGVIDKVDYLHELGVTAVLLSPFIANKWVDPGHDIFPPYTGYHGYWPVSFMHVDQHLGTVADLQRLSSLLHDRGMYLIIDAVANHTAHYYHYEGPYNPQDPTENFVLLEDQQPPRPLMSPFDLNDVRNQAHRDAAIYHWTPPITDYFDTEQLEQYQLELVNDLNTSNPRVRTALKLAYRCWIEEIGVDGFRIDAAKHVEREFWSDFLYAEDGVLAHAAKLGKKDFLTYGEIWTISPPFENTAENSISEFIEQGDESGFKTAMAFPLFSTLNKVINAYRPTELLAYRLQAQMQTYPDPNVVINFLDSHDVPRFIESGDVARLKKALTVLLTVPGTPLIYQGDEQGFEEQRQAMFEGGYLALQDHFDQSSDLYKTVSELIKVRRGYDGVFSRGQIKSVKTNPIGPGVLAYQRTLDNQTGLVVINTSSSHPVLVNNISTGLPGGSTFKAVFQRGWEHTPVTSLISNSDGGLTFELPADAITILLHDTQKPTQTVLNKPHISIESLKPDTVIQQTQRLSGTSSLPNTELHVLLDGNTDPIAQIKTDDSGNWSTKLEPLEMLQREHFIGVYAPTHATASAPLRFVSDRTPLKTVTLEDPAKDDHGLDGLYVKPTDETFARRLDVRRVDLAVSDFELILSVTMGEMADEWSFPNGFQNVSFQIFFDSNAIDNITETLPWISATAPSEFYWDAAHIAYGFENKVYRNTDGKPARVQSADPQLKRVGNTLHIRYRCDAFVVPCDRPLKVYLTTWDREVDGKLRPMKSDPGPWHFANNGRLEARIIDDALIEF